MKSRKFILVGFLVIASFIGFATLQDDVIDGNQFVDVSEFPSEVKTITIELADGVGSGDNG